MAEVFRIASSCECEAYLSATLNAAKQVVTGQARFGDALEKAPAHTIAVDPERFDVAWQCPFCGRNTMRTFFAGALTPLAPGAAAN